MKKKVEYVGFSLDGMSDRQSTKPTKTMIYVTDVQRVFTVADLKSFLRQTLFTE